MSYVGGKSQGFREETFISVCTAGALMDQGVITGSWALRGMAPFGHCNFLRSRDLRREP